MSTAIDAKPYWGPLIPRGMDRVIVPYDSSLAAAYIPSSFEAQKCPAVDLSLIRSLQGDLENHFEYRIQVFFQQLLLAYKTNLIFELYTKADFQIGQGASEKGHIYVAAHSSTLPTLRIPDGKDSRSFGRDTYFYHTWNATIYLPEIVNQTDSAIDRHCNDQKSFREVATELLNQASQGNLPGAVLEEFLKQAVKTLSALKDPCTNQSRSIVLDAYLKIAKRYLYNLTEEPLIQKLCFEKEDARITDLFYLNVQKPMHELLRKQCKNTTPSRLLSPPSLNWSDLRKKLWAKIENNALHLTERSASYKALICLSDNVTNAAYQILATPDGVQTLLESSSKTALHEAAQTEITEKCSVKNPKNLEAIVFHYLTVLCDRLSTAPQADDAAQKNKSEPVIPKLETVLSPQRANYKKLCSESQKVQEALAKAWGFLQQASDLCKQQELKKISSIATSKTVEKLGLSDAIFNLYATVRTTIRESAQVEEPQKIGLILIHLLHDFETAKKKADQTAKKTT